MLGIAFLNEIVRKKEIKTSAAVLEDLRNEIKTSFKQSIGKKSIKDGMDIAVCVINKQKSELQFAGANNGMYLIQNGQITVIKPTRNPIGAYFIEKPFHNNMINFNTNTLIYLFSDGYIDQFGGSTGRKFYSKNFKKLLLENHHKPMKEQKAVLENTFNEWKGKNEQLDDVLVLGVRL